MATKSTHPYEWEQFLLHINRKDFDNPLFKHYRNLFFSASKTEENPAVFSGKAKLFKVTKADGTTEVHRGFAELKQKLGVHHSLVYREAGKVIQRGRLKGWRIDIMPDPVPIYALYEEEEILGIGTLNELSEEMGITVNTLEHYLYSQTRPSTHRRLVLVDVELPEMELEK